MRSAPNTDGEDEVLTYACYVRRPRSTYDFGVWAWSLRREGAAAGTAAFEVFDGGFNDCSEVLYADLLFVPGAGDAGDAGDAGSAEETGSAGSVRSPGPAGASRVGAIVVSSFFAVDFGGGDEASREEEMNPTVFPHIVRALLKMHPGFGRVETREKAGSTDCAEASPLVRGLRRAFGESVFNADEAALLRPLYAVLGARSPATASPATDEAATTEAATAETATAEPATASPATASPATDEASAPGGVDPFLGSDKGNAEHEDDAALRDRVRREMWELSEGMCGPDGDGFCDLAKHEVVFARTARVDALV